MAFEWNFENVAPYGAAGVSGLGFILNLLNSARAAQEQAKEREWWRDPSNLVRAAQAIPTGLTPELQAYIGQQAQGALGERGLHSAPGVVADWTARALAPYYMRDWQARLGEASRARGMVGQYPYPTFPAGIDPFSAYGNVRLLQAIMEHMGRGSKKEPGIVQSGYMSGFEDPFASASGFGGFPTAEQLIPTVGSQEGAWAGPAIEAGTPPPGWFPTMAPWST